MGGSASFGYGRTDASNQSSSNAYGYSQGVTGSQSTNAQSVYGAQEPALSQLYGAAGDLLSGTSAPGAVAGGIGAQGADAWASLLRPGANPYSDAAVQASIDDATEAFKRQVLPELDARGVGAGQYGSSRDALARGEAAGMFGGELAQRTAQMRSDLYTGDMNRVLSAVGMTPMLQQSAFAPLSVAASLIGGPTVLGQGQSSSFGTQTAENWAQSQSSGRSSGRQYNTSGSGGIGGGKN